MFLMVATKAVKNILFLLLINSVSWAPLYGTFNISEDSRVIRAEDSIRVLFENAAKSSSASEWEHINLEIISIFEDILKEPESFFHSFESLTSVGKITSSDERLSVYTWNYSETQADHKYYGFLQYRNPEDNKINLYFLNHSEGNNEDFETSTFSAEEWYGALYYQINDVEHQGETYYNLIGFDFNDVFTNIKIIDILSFSEGVPEFGAPVFRFGEGMKHRVVFEYSSRAVMFLRYIPERDMIIYDHLSPSSPRFKGQFRYYGPDFTYDAFRFDNGRWIHMSDIDWSPR